MDGTTSFAGAAFSVLAIVGAIPSAVYLFQHRRELDPVSNTTGRTLVAAAIFNGLVNVVRKMGLIPDDATYQTLDLASLVLYGIMMYLFFRAQKGRWKRDIAG
ncbi:MAG TPA: hypothetical protein VF887_06750 [Gemmatimonadaceae bacterium]